MQLFHVHYAFSPWSGTVGGQRHTHYYIVQTPGTLEHHRLRAVQISFKYLKFIGFLLKESSIWIHINTELKMSPIAGGWFWRRGTGTCFMVVKPGSQGQCWPLFHDWEKIAIPLSRLKRNQSRLNLRKRFYHNKISCLLRNLWGELRCIDDLFMFRVDLAFVDHPQSPRKGQRTFSSMNRMTESNFLRSHNACQKKSCHEV